MPVKVLSDRKSYSALWQSKRKHKHVTLLSIDACTSGNYSFFVINLH